MVCVCNATTMSMTEGGLGLGLQGQLAGLVDPNWKPTDMSQFGKQNLM